MTELTRQTTRDKGQGKKYTVYSSEIILDTKSELRRQKKERGGML